jgi:hypothetical protein
MLTYSTNAQMRTNDLQHQSDLRTRGKRAKSVHSKTVAVGRSAES